MQPNCHFICLLFGDKLVIAVRGKGVENWIGKGCRLLWSWFRKRFRSVTMKGSRRHPSCAIAKMADICSDNMDSSKETEPKPSNDFSEKLKVTILSDSVLNWIAVSINMTTWQRLCILSARFSHVNDEIFRHVLLISSFEASRLPEWNSQRQSWEDNKDGDPKNSEASSGDESPPSDIPASSSISNTTNVLESFVQAIEKNEVNEKPDLETQLKILRWMRNCGRDEKELQLN
ncbi:unnamed protein product [Enterobius vermicularis]|uniref:F-box protein n=1 Tax=Enterobius vermicularis TaxID=51028 RepID=A0A0N4VEJ0_ENTVE|nr:unnamed protein product [Enterobius vermicularis]